MHYRFPVAMVLIALAASAQARIPELKLPKFSHLQSEAVDSVDITLGSLSLTIASRFLRDGDAEQEDLKAVFKALQSVRVHHYEFASDFVYSKADIDAVRSQLSRDGWSQLAQVRDRKNDEATDVYVSLENDKITGITIVANEPREFTIIHVIGSLDVQQAEKLRAHFVASAHQSAAKP